METTLPSHLTLVRRAEINKINDRIYWQGCEEKDTFPHCICGNQCGGSSGNWEYIDLRIQLYQSPSYTQRTPTPATETLAHPCSSLLCLLSEIRNCVDVYQLINKKYVVHLHTIILFNCYKKLNHEA